MTLQEAEHTMNKYGLGTKKGYDAFKLQRELKRKYKSKNNDNSK